MADIDELKRLNPIEDVIQELGMPLDTRTRGKYLSPPKGTKEGGLVVNVNEQIYYWNNKAEWGDVLDYLVRYHGHTFKSAMQLLADRAGVPISNDPEVIKRQAATRVKHDALTKCMEFLQQKLRDTPAAAEYCTSRGWTTDSIERSGVGYWDGDTKGLSDHLRLNNVDLAGNGVTAVLNMPKGMLVYGHWEAHRCVYMSGRSIEGKRHYNLPEKLVGARRYYWNWQSARRDDLLVICEGQADAISYGQWGIPAVALAGVSLSTSDENAINRLKKQVDGFNHVAVALDRDQAGAAQAQSVSKMFGIMTRILMLPAESEGQPIKDANDWLKLGAESKDVLDRIEESPIHPVFMCHVAGQANRLESEKLTREAMEQFTKLSPYKRAEHRRAAADALNVSLKRFDEMVKALDVEHKAAEKKRSNKETRRMVGGYEDGYLFEMIYDPVEKRTAFVVRDPEGRISIQPSIELEYYEAVPLPPWDDTVIAGGIKLPSGIDDYGDVKNLIKSIRQYLYKYVDAPDDMERLGAYYALLTWMADCFPVVPYLRGLGQTGSGKTRYIKTIGSISFRAKFTIGSSSVSSIFRTIKEYGMITLVMDEADFDKSDATADIINLINTGNNKDFPIWRVEKRADGTMTQVAFQTFGPKLFSQRQPFKDEATNSRCITWSVNGGIPRSDIPILVNRKVAEAEATALRNMLLKFRMDHWQDDLDIDYNGGDRRLPGRLRQIMIPLLTLAPEIGEELNEFMRNVAAQTMTDWRSRVEAKILYALIRNHFRPHGEAAMHGGELALSVKNIAQEANRIMDIENATGQGDEDVNKRKRITSRGASYHVRNSLNLSTERGKVGTRPSVVIWDDKRIESLVIRYGLEEELAAFRKGEPDYFDPPSRQKEIDL